MSYDGYLAPWVSLIMRWYAAGFSPREMADELYEMGVRGAHGSIPENDIIKYAIRQELGDRISRRRLDARVALAEPHMLGQVVGFPGDLYGHWYGGKLW